MAVNAVKFGGKEIAKAVVGTGAGVLLLKGAAITAPVLAAGLAIKHFLGDKQQNKISD
ncbi:MAG: hypothetical protein ACK587_05480 [Cyanobacteriota bacterium]